MWVHNATKQKNKKNVKRAIISILQNNNASDILGVLKWTISIFLCLLHNCPCLFVYACMQSLHFNYVNTRITLYTPVRCSDLVFVGILMRIQQFYVCTIFAKNVCVVPVALIATCGLNFMYGCRKQGRCHIYCTSEAHMQTHT